MTPAILRAAAEPEAGFTLTQLWILAVGSGVVLTVALATLPLVSPRTRRRASVWVRLAFAVSVPVVSALFVVGRSARGTDDAVDALHIYILVALALAILRVIFARWLERVAEANLSGTPTETSGGKVAVVFLAAFAAVVASLVGLLVWLPTVWA